MIPLHPDDVLFFNEVCDAMRRVAADYNLPLRSIRAYTMPESGMADRLGDCSHDGDIRLVMRATVDGVFCDAPRSPEDVWRTAAHELAHLKHMNHGEAFWEFHRELMRAITNQKTDHKEKVLARLVKMQEMREGFARMGSENEAEAFAGMINKMLLQHELNPSDIDYARATDNDPIIEIGVDLEKYDVKKKSVRIAWQESLARIVAKAHLCSFLIVPGSNRIYFVGTKSHATVAEYSYGTLVHATEEMARKEYWAFRRECLKRDGHKRAANGFREAWLNAFLKRIEERFNVARQAAVAEAPEGASVALIRLDGALVKTRKYIDDKFKAKNRYASSLTGPSRTHAEGSTRGRAAADRMTIGRKGLTTATRKQLN